MTAPLPGTLASGLKLVAGAYDGLSAALVERAGFDAVWASGFSISASRMLPDRSVITVDDLVGQVEQMTRAVHLPVLVDCDEGYGALENTRELAERLAACGAAGVCIEDSVYPKVNSFWDGPGRALSDVDCVARKLQVIRATAPDLILVARTESLIAGQPLEIALERGMRYADLGADLVVLHSRFTKFDEFRALAESWEGRVPLAVIPTMSHDASWSDLLGMGFGMVIYANQALRASVHAQERVLRDIRSLAGPSSPESGLVTLEHMFWLTNLRDWVAPAGNGR